MIKPFSIQAPEEVAKEYGGNKQKIAQAAQLGIIDPTAAVLAGMFIDKMRAGQMQEAMQKPTIAQQVFAQGQLAPTSQLDAELQAAFPDSYPVLRGGEATGGLGATPQAAPQEEAPMGMAEGGIAGIDIPDTMYDEPSNGGFNDSYAPGGLVAFAGGGMSNLHDSIEYWESGGKQSAVSPKGARGVMQLMPGTSRDPGFGVTPARDDSEGENRRVGREYVDALYRRYGDQATALAAYNWGPGNVDRWLKAGGDPAKLPAETRKYVANVMGGDAPPIRERDTKTLAGSMGSTEDVYKDMLRRFGPTEAETAANDAIIARAKEMASDEGYEKRRKADMWQTLAEIGFGMASSKSPSFLQAVGEAAMAAMPGARADKKEREAIKDRGLALLSDITGKSRKENLDLYKLAVDTTKDHIAQQQRERQLDIETKNADTQAVQAQNQKDYQTGMLGARQAEVEAGKGPLQQMAKAIYESLKLQNEQGKYRDRMGNVVPYKVADSEILNRAYEEAASRLHPGQAGGFDVSTGVPSPTIAGGAGGQSTGNTVDFNALK